MDDERAARTCLDCGNMGLYEEGGTDFVLRCCRELWPEESDLPTTEAKLRFCLSMAATCPSFEPREP